MVTRKGLLAILILSFIAFLFFGYAYIGTLVSLKYECEDAMYESERLLTTHCKGLRNQSFIYAGLALVVIVSFATSVILLIRKSHQNENNNHLSDD